MRTKKKSVDKMVKVPESTLMSLVVDRLRYKVLFPEKVEEARKYISSIKTSPFHS